MKVFFSIVFISAFFFGFNVLGQSLRINEFSAKNASTYADETGQYDDWIEISNTTGNDINLDGYFITDNISIKTKFLLTAPGNELVVPANGFFILWADDDEFQGYNHLIFNLSGEGGIIALYSPTVQLVDSVNYTTQYTDVSRGRQVSNPSVWKFFSPSTPGESNESQSFAGVAGTPVFTKTSGIYTSPTNINLISSHFGDSVFYTLNNSTPTASSVLYQNTISLNTTQVIRAISSKHNFVSSNVVSHIFIENEAYTLPVFAIITDSVNLFGSTGIYTNYSQPWEKFCQIKYLKDNVLAAESNAGIAIQGASSVPMPKKSFRLFFRGEYGNKNLEYHVFNDTLYDKFDKLVLKSGYDDDITTENGTLLRDALILELWKKTGGLPQLSSWVNLYLNHQYWGIYNLRESIDENFIKDHTGLDFFDLVRFRNAGAEAEYGTLNNWSPMHNNVVNNDLSVAQNYQQITSILDIDDFANLMAFVQCSHYYSWPWGISMYREINPASKWKVSIWDADRAFTDVNWDGFNEAQNITEPHKWANIYPQKLIANTEFRIKYKNRIIELLNTVFEPDNAIAVLDSLYNIVKPEMNNEFARWDPDNSNWEANVEEIRDFLRNRPAILQTQMSSYLSSLENPGENSDLNLYGVYPNPFNSQCRIKFFLTNDNHVEISIFDTQGKLIKQLYNGTAHTGEFSMEWNGDQTDLSKATPGVYIIQIKTPEGIKHGKVIFNP